MNIQSRTTIIRIKKVTNTNFKKIFKKIKKKENILIDEEGEQFLYKICNNSINKLTNYLQKIKLYNKKTDIVTVKNICTNISFFVFEKYTTLWMEKNYSESIKLIMEIYKRGYSVLDILDNYFSFIKITNMIDEEKKYKIIKFICKYIENFYTKHEDEIELSFFTNNLIINLS